MVSPIGKKRFLVFISAVVGWSFCFFCQRTLPSVIGYMTVSDTAQGGLRGEQSKPVITREEYGRLQNIFVIAYSSSILVSGFLSDYINPRLLFFISMGMSGVFCAVFPLTIGSPFLCSLVWFLFGCFEGCCWPATAKMVKQMYTPSELGMWWSFLSGASNCAAAVSPLFIASIVKNTNWQTCFYITGIIPIILLPLILYMIRSNCVVTPGKQPNPQDHSVRHSTQWYEVFFVSTLQLVIVVYIILWVAKSSIHGWALLYLQEVVQLPREALAVSLMQLGGVFGKLSMGNLSTWLIKKKLMKRASLLCVSMSTLALLVFVFGAESFKDQSEMFILLVMFFVGFSIDGSVVLTNLAAMETVPDSLCGSALGLATFLSQFVGRSFGAGFAFSYLQQSYGWTTIYQAVAVLCVAASTLGGYIALINTQT